jgi:hypothetical protein
VLRELLLLLYCGAVGFVAAGVTASFYKMITSEPARFRLLGESAFAWATTLTLCALTGPVIVMEQAIRAASKDRVPLKWLLAGAGIAAMWSCCVGVVVLELVLALRDTFA